MNNILEIIKDFISSLSDKVTSFYEENKKISFIILGLILVILICLILLVSTAEKDKKKSKEIPGSNLQLTETLIIPNGPELPRDYNISRKTKDKWTEEEAEPWFTVPTDKEIEALGKSNENMVNEIIGAAP